VFVIITIMKKITQHAGVRILIAPAFLFLFIFLNSCMNTNNPMYTNTSNNTSGTPGANEVFIQGMAFSPTTLNVTAGTVVKWTNKDALVHTVTSDSTLFDSGNIAVNGVYSYTFNSAGTFTYHCKIHPTMKGTVVVTAYVVPGY